jgi:hypothetical protein
MATTHSDRRRFFLATSLTLLALPALWWVNRSEGSAAPNVAVAGAGVGVDVGADHDGAEPPTATAPTSAPAAAPEVAPATVDASTLDASTSDASTSDASTLDASASGAAAAAAESPAADEGTDGDEPGAVAPVFLEGPSAQVGSGLAEIAVPAPPAVARVSTTATFRNSVTGRDTCVVPGLLDGGTVTVVNLDNGHRVTCAATFVPGNLGDEILLSRHAFSQLADLTDAPIPVEIRR